MTKKARYDVEHQVPWGFAPRGEPTAFEEVGVWYQLNVQPKLSISTTWRSIRLPTGPAEKPYRIVEIPFRAEHVTNLFVFVDLRQGKVASIIPGAGSKLIVPAKYRHLLRHKPQSH